MKPNHISGFKERKLSEMKPIKITDASVTRGLCHVEAYEVRESSRFLPPCRASATILGPICSLVRVFSNSSKRLGWLLLVVTLFFHDTFGLNLA